MDKGVPPSLFVNDGSFMERFKQLQEEQEKKNANIEDSKPIKIVSGSLTPNLSFSKKTSTDFKANDSRKTSQAGSSGKLAFSLKQKSRLVPPPVKLAADDDEEEETNGINVSSDAPSKRQKLGQEDGIEQSDGGNYFSKLLLLSSCLVVDSLTQCSSAKELGERKKDVNLGVFVKYVQNLPLSYLGEGALECLLPFPACLGIQLGDLGIYLLHTLKLCSKEDKSLECFCLMNAAYSSREWSIAPSSPSDPTVKKVAEKLASFVAKNGRQFEDVTRQKNPGDTPFKFLFDVKCSDYKYYEYLLAQEEKALAQPRESETSRNGGTSTSSSRITNVPQRSSQQHSTYQIPASALYESSEDPRGYGSSGQAGSRGSTDDTGGSSNANSLALMEFYMKKAAQEEKRKQPRQSKDEMPPPASLQATPSKKGHHMGDYIPLEELEKFMANCNDAAAQKAAKEAAERAKIQADNVGHRLLSKMGWKEGEGLGSSGNGISDPIMAGNVKMNNLGVGANNPGEVTPDDDIYEQYKKRMMLGYRYRPNPMVYCVLVF
ncbi:SURP and G-patch domain-containing protein 1-like protein isoform X1 [Senna tora]|uniref:SURP and G-patch domain-containing protein 1-like protein isoform X1 n=1 Tax=Senna tora TaxID=362788 RepID=A0A834TLJ1_9FABA|nr:SURP and G-patch domain-containing protein 1-like protein isoform X1 [Senna tora]